MQTQTEMDESWERVARRLEEEKQAMRELIYKYMAFVNSFHGETGTQRLNLTNEYLIYHRAASKAAKSFKFTETDLQTLKDLDNEMLAWDTENTY